MFQYSFHTRNGKTRYRGLFKHRMHAYARSMWMNLRRVILFQLSETKNAILAIFAPLGSAFYRLTAVLLMNADIVAIARPSRKLAA